MGLPIWLNSKLGALVLGLTFSRSIYARLSMTRAATDRALLPVVAFCGCDRRGQCRRRMVLTDLQFVA
jgi:hypothetical protein